jgi:hypothetical protein
MCNKYEKIPNRYRKYSGKSLDLEIKLQRCKQFIYFIGNIYYCYGRCSNYLVWQYITDPIIQSDTVQINMFKKSVNNACRHYGIPQVKSFDACAFSQRDLLKNPLSNNETNVYFA